MKLRVGLVGLGSAWESRHRPALRALADRFQICGICEPVAHRAEQAAREFETHAVDGYRALAAREDIDAILLLSAKWFGALPILAACETGKALYCAAALDLAGDEALDVKGRVEEAGVAFMAEFPCRQMPATLRLKELIATHLGPPQMLFCHQRRTVDSQACVPDRSQMRDLIEIVDWCRYVIAEEPTAVTGAVHLGEGNSANEDYHMMSLDFSPAERRGTGAMAQISCGRYIPADWLEAISFRPPASLQVACERGIAFIDLPSTLIWFDRAGRHMESLDSERPVGERLLCDFHRAVTSLVRHTASLEDAYRALTVVNAAKESHRLGRRIDLDFAS